MKTFVSLATALLAAAVLGFVPPAQARTVGSGQVATETRSVGAFDAVSVAGSIDVVVRQAAAPSVQVQADSNVLPLVETVVESTSRGRTLVVKLRRGESVSTRHDIVVTVDTPTLAAISSAGAGDVKVEGLKTPALRLSIAGSSDVRIAGLDTESFELRIAGSGDVVAAGRAATVSVGISGSGDADLAGLVADDVKVRIAGSGDASVTANRALDVSVVGSGDVRYGGNASAVKLSAAGSGTVSKR